MPTPGRPERSGLCEDDDPGIFGYFPSLESTSPGGEISPVLRQKSGPRDGQKANFKRRAGSSRPTAGRPYDPRTLHGVGNESNGAPGKAEGFVGERRSRKVSELSPFRRKRGIQRRQRRCRGGCHPPAGDHRGGAPGTHLNPNGGACLCLFPEKSPKTTFQSCNLLGLMIKYRKIIQREEPLL